MNLFEANLIDYLDRVLLVFDDQPKSFVFSNMSFGRQTLSHLMQHLHSNLMIVALKDGFSRF